MFARAGDFKAQRFDIEPHALRGLGQHLAAGFWHVGFDDAPALAAYQPLLDAMFPGLSARDVPIDRGDVVGQTGFFKRGQDPVDGHHIDSAAPLHDPFMDLVGAERLVGLTQNADHLQARHGNPMPSLFQRSKAQPLEFLPFRRVGNVAVAAFQSCALISHREALCPLKAQILSNLKKIMGITTLKGSQERCSIR